MSELGDIFKQTAICAVEAQKPVEAFLGRVTNISPIEIKASQKLYLHEENLITPEIPVTGTVAVNINECSREFPFTGTATVRNALCKNDKVVLLRTQKGQKYIVMGRIV